MKIGTFNFQELDPNPPDVNPFLYDIFNMGTPIGNNVWIMHRNHTTEKTEYFIITNVETGERVKVILNQEKETK